MRSTSSRDSKGRFAHFVEDMDGIGYIAHKDKTAPYCPYCPYFIHEKLHAYHKYSLPLFTPHLYSWPISPPQ